MLTKNLNSKMNEYDIIDIQEDHYNDVYKLYKTNDYYFSLERDEEITLDICIQDIKDIPPKTNPNQKYYVGFYKNNNLEAILDIIVDYLSIGNVWIGLLLIEGNHHKKGIGKNIINNLIQTLKEMNYKKLQIAVIDENEIAHLFWISLGFKEIKRLVNKKEGRKDWNLIVMENSL